MPGRVDRYGHAVHLQIDAVLADSFEPRAIPLDQAAVRRRLQVQVRSRAVDDKPPDDAAEVSARVRGFDLNDVVPFGQLAQIEQGSVAGDGLDLRPVQSQPQAGRLVARYANLNAIRRRDRQRLVLRLALLFA
ncbi:hypothetical protein J19TS2_09870 [Cohnella xylanilytica]|nr:hypothetical protein J19TS2_09870 [Cohnella xylanilytica]